MGLSGKSRFMRRVHQILTQSCAAILQGTQMGLSGKSRFMRRVHQILVPSCLGRGQGATVRALYRQYDYLDAYSRHTDLRVDRNPHAAVGGKWEEIGQLQFDFLVAKGLKPHHTLLDIGCGTLRGGRHFIRYLDVGKYTGIDISEKALAYANNLVEEERLSEKHPRLLLNREKKLLFTDFAGETFDYLLAQSVFTHLMPEHIEECFQNIQRIMHTGSLFFFTFRHARSYKRMELKAFGYPIEFFHDLSQHCGYLVEDCSKEYLHPRGQGMLMVKLA